MPMNRPHQSIGVFLRLLETLPEYRNDTHFCEEINKNCAFSRPTLTRLKTFEREFPKKNVETSVRGFCSAVCEVLRQHEFFCQHDRKIMMNFLSNELGAIVAADTLLDSKFTIRNYMEHPFVRGLEDADFLMRFYESIYWICLLSIKAGNNQLNRLPQPDSWIEWETRLEKIHSFYVSYMQQPGDQKDDSSLWTLSTANATPPAFAQQSPETERLRKERAAEFFSLGSRGYDCLINARNNGIDRVPHANVPHRMRFYRHPGMQSGINLPYNELITCAENTPRLTRERFIISYNDELIEVPKTDPQLSDPFRTVHENRDLYQLYQMEGSLRSGYQPISYRKLHINTLTKCNICPGYEADFQYSMEVQPIEFFDHQIIRAYLRGSDKYGGNPHSEEDIENYHHTRDVFDTSIRFSPADGIMPNKAFYLMAGCGIWVLTRDHQIMVSVRKRVQEKPQSLGYSAAGSCEYSNRFSSENNIDPQHREADPFLSVVRELHEECGIIAPIKDIEVISFGIDYDRYLQQWSFLYKSNLTARDILDNAEHALSRNEQDLFAVPFNRRSILRLIDERDGYDMEPGAIVSLLNLMNRYSILLD